MITNLENITNVMPNVESIPIAKSLKEAGLTVFCYGVGGILGIGMYLGDLYLRRVKHKKGFDLTTEF